MTPLRLNLLKTLYNLGSISSVKLFEPLSPAQKLRWRGRLKKVTDYFDKVELDIVFEPPSVNPPVVEILETPDTPIDEPPSEKQDLPTVHAVRSVPRRKKVLSIGERVHLRHSSIASRVARRRRKQ